MATVSVFGLGYVGSVLAACLAESGHRVIGVDANPMKVEMITLGRSPIVENGLDALLARGVEKGLIEATTVPEQAVLESEISVICVGTPSNCDGSPNLSQVRKVGGEIGSALKKKVAFHVVALRSTVPPGTTEDLLIPVLERSSGKKTGLDFGVCFNPEFLREGTSVQDFHAPPFTVIGTDDKKAAEAVTGLYSMLAAPVFTVPFKVAEMLKYANNAFHALKVCFANEIGNICRRQGIDSHQVMELFCMDRKLNLSSYYLKPGFAFGGACLPKDLRALLHRSRHLDLSVPVLESILASNTRQVEIACEMLEELGRRRIGVCGFSFKPDTDDLRESPIVRLIEFLLGKGYQLKVYDENVSLARLHGGNRAYIEQTVPHIACLFTDSLEVMIDWSELIVVGNEPPLLRSALARLRPDQVIVDLIRIKKCNSFQKHQYQGICW